MGLRDRDVVGVRGSRADLGVDLGVAEREWRAVASFRFRLAAMPSQADDRSRRRVRGRGLLPLAAPLQALARLLVLAVDLSRANRPFEKR